MFSRLTPILCAASLTACAQTGRIAVVSSSGFYGAQAESAAVTLRSSVPLDRFADDVRPAEAVSYICGEYERFKTASRLVDAGEPNVYSAAFPPLSQRTVWQPDGRVERGWPSDLAAAKGICLRVEAAQMLHATLRTNEVSVPPEIGVR